MNNAQLIAAMRDLIDLAREKAYTKLESLYSDKVDGILLQGIGDLADATMKLTIAEKVQNQLDGLE